MDSLVEAKAEDALLLPALTREELRSQVNYLNGTTKNGKPCVSIPGAGHTGSWFFYAAKKVQIF
jgi:hypothetical protein